MHPSRENRAGSNHGCRRTKLKAGQNFLHVSTVDLKTKLLELAGGNYLMVTARGQVDVEGLEEIFREVSAISKSLLNFRVLIDLAVSRIRLALPDIDVLVNSLDHHLLHRNIQIAVASSIEIDEFDRLCVLCASLRSLGLKVAAFDDAKSAVVWLADIT
jgi:hypothetical protein